MADLIAGWSDIKTDNIPAVGGYQQHTSPAGFVHALPRDSDAALCSHFIYYREGDTPWSLVSNSPQACPRCATSAAALE